VDGKSGRGQTFTMQNHQPDADDGAFGALRGRVRNAEVLSAAFEKLPAMTRFTGRVSVVVQNGRILKSGYEEGYFTRRQQQRMIP
jgi:hypothetical protein